MKTLKIKKSNLSKWRFLEMTVIAIAIFILIFIAEAIAGKEPIREEEMATIFKVYHYDKTVPLNARVISEGQWEPVFPEDHPCGCREKIVFTGGRGDRVPGYLGLPKAGKAPYPCVLAIHGGSNRKLAWWEDDSFSYGGLLTKALLASGFAVFALDSQYHGERIKNNDYELWGALREREEHDKVNAMWVETTLDYQRALDYLETRPEIDMNRVGVIGYSMGACITFALKAVEPRIKSAVACSSIPFKSPPWPSQYVVWAPYYIADFIDDEYPLLMMNGNSCEYCTVEDARELFNSIDSPNKELVFYDSGHKLPPEYVSDAADWFKVNLKYKYRTKINSKKMK